MKYLDKLINFIFSLSILILAIVVIMVSAGFIEYAEVDNFIRMNIFSPENNTMTCIVAIIVVLAALKTTIFLSKTNNKRKNVIMVDTNHGKVQIAQDTVENTAKSAIKEFDEIKDAQVRMVKERKGINVYMMLLVLPNTNIIELSAKVQDSVKKAIEETTSVKVNNVDIKVKNITDIRKFKNKEKEEVKEVKINNEEAIIENSNVEIENSLSNEENSTSNENLEENINNDVQEN